MTKKQFEKTVIDGLRSGKLKTKYSGLWLQLTDDRRHLLRLLLRDYIVGGHLYETAKDLLAELENKQEAGK